MTEILTAHITMSQPVPVTVHRKPGVLMRLTPCKGWRWVRDEITGAWHHQKKPSLRCRAADFLRRVFV